MTLLRCTTFVSLVKSECTVRRLREEMEKAGKSLEDFTDVSIIEAMLAVLQGDNDDDTEVLLKA